jgi:GGDEF domain-containing protein
MPNKEWFRRAASRFGVFSLSQGDFSSRDKGDLSRAVEAMTRGSDPRLLVQAMGELAVKKGHQSRLSGSIGKAIGLRYLMKWIMEKNMPGVMLNLRQEVRRLIENPGFVGGRDLVFEKEALTDLHWVWENPVKGNTPEVIAFVPGPEIDQIYHLLGEEEVRNQLNLFFYSVFFLGANKDLVEELEADSVIDRKTRLYNQKFFNQRLTENFHIARKYQRPFFACLFLVHPADWRYPEPLQAEHKAFLKAIGAIARETLPTNSYLSRLTQFELGGFFPEISLGNIKMAVERFRAACLESDNGVSFTAVLFQWLEKDQNLKEFGNQLKVVLEKAIVKAKDKLIIRDEAGIHAEAFPAFQPASPTEA